MRKALEPIQELVESISIETFKRTSHDKLLSPARSPACNSLVRATLDDAWDCLRPHQKSTMLKTDLAERILNVAAEGERDRERLLNVALTGLIS